MFSFVFAKWMIRQQIEFSGRNKSMGFFSKICSWKNYWTLLLRNLEFSIVFSSFGDQFAWSIFPALNPSHIFLDIATVPIPRKQPPISFFPDLTQILGWFFIVFAEFSPSDSLLAPKPCIHQLDLRNRAGFGFWGLFGFVGLWGCLRLFGFNGLWVCFIRNISLWVFPKGATWRQETLRGGAGRFQFPFDSGTVNMAGKKNIGHIRQREKMKERSENKKNTGGK